MEQIPKIQLSNEADLVLEEMLRLSNQDFNSGRVKKSQLLSWIVLHFHQSHFKKNLKKIRADHFDKIAHLRSVIREMEAAKKQGHKIEVGHLLTPLNSKPIALKPAKAKPDEN